MYLIRRLYRDQDPPLHGTVIRRGLTLAEARAHCNDPETSSRTCTTVEGHNRTATLGPWFDSYDEDPDDPEVSHGWVCDYDTAEPIRPATREERQASDEAAEIDGGAGVITDEDGRAVYVEP